VLTELRIRNFAVIHDLSLELGPGLNALTGETGAGKSIIVGALSLLLGERATSEVVRTGSDRAVVEAVFDLSRRPDLTARLAELGLEPEDGLLVLRREVHREGRNRAWINGSAATASVVGEIGRALVDLHGQHEHQTLLDPVEQRRILDAFSGAEPVAEEVAERHGRLAALERDIEDLRGRRKDLAARADFLRFQRDEIRGARIRPDEDAHAQAELERLEHAEELANDSEAAHRLLYADEGAVSDELARVRDLLRRLARFDPELGASAEEAEDLYHRAVELGRALGAYASSVEVSPGRTEALRRRLDALFRLKGKYGPSLADVIAAGERLESELGALDGSDIEIEGLEKQVESARKALVETAARLTTLRLKGARVLEEVVQEALPDLGMPGSRFGVQIEPLENVEAGGAERVRFVGSLNQGFELRPLAKIASGGELSRVMLALKSALARQDRVPTLVFDEIDSGIGGVVATAVARKLREVAEHHQVFVITHLAQLASRGHQHLRVEKHDRDGLAEAAVEALEGEGRILEIARMLGGDPDSEASRKHARELLAAG
jgi:DNA repair protein RecN (Recombination protein N)